MRNALILPGVQNPSGLPFEFSPEDLYLGRIPDLAVLIDPAVRVRSNASRVYNRRTNTVLQNRAGDTTEARDIPVGAFPNGEIGFLPTSTTALSVTMPVAINRNAFTFFGVMRQPAVGSPQRSLAASLPSFTAQSPAYNLRVGFENSPQRMVFWRRGASGSDSSRLSHTPSVSINERVVLSVFSFSTARGITIRLNGAQVAYEPNDREPLAAGYGANEWRMFDRMNGLIGVSGLVNRDLTRVENAGWLAGMETFLMEKYSIV